MKAIVIVAGGLHLGYLGCYGNDWIETPTLDQLATRGVVFEQHYSDRPDPKSARRSLWTGSYSFPLPDEMGTRHSGRGPRLSRPGVATALVTCSSLPAAPDELSSVWNETTIVPSGAAGKTSWESARQAATEAARRLRRMDQYLLWIELPSLAPPWSWLPEEFQQMYFGHEVIEDDSDIDREESAMEEAEDSLAALPEPATGFDRDEPAMWHRLQRTYAGTVSYLDHELGKLLVGLTAVGLGDDAARLFTATHGMPLGEHGAVGCERPWLHDELIHLPLIVRLPDNAEAGRRVSALTQPVDLLPTLSELFGMPFDMPPVLTHGYSLVPWMRGRSQPVRQHAPSGLRIGEAVEWALRTPKWALLLPLSQAPQARPRQRQLYVKPDDRWEVNNVVQHHHEEADELEQELRHFATRCGDSAGLKPAETQGGLEG